MTAVDPGRLQLTLNEIRNVAAGVLFGEPDPAIRAAADTYAEVRSSGGWLVVADALTIGAVAALRGLERNRPGLRARNAGERVGIDGKSTRQNCSHEGAERMPDTA